MNSFFMIKQRVDESLNWLYDSFFNILDKKYKIYFMKFLWYWFRVKKLTCAFPVQVQQSRPKAPENRKIYFVFTILWKTDSDFNYKAFCTCEITLQPFIKWFLFDKITIYIIFVEKAWEFMKFLPE